MRDFAECVAEARRTGAWQPLVEMIPYARFMGLSVQLADGQVIGKLAFSEMLIGNPALPALHGGTLGALLESTSVFQVLVGVETAALPKIVSITVEYLRSGKPIDTWAKALVTRQGRRIVNVRAEAWQDDPARPIATAHAHFLVS